jgi:hypothetical protein
MLSSHYEKFVEFTKSNTLSEYLDNQKELTGSIFLGFSVPVISEFASRFSLVKMVSLMIILFSYLISR